MAGSSFSACVGFSSVPFSLSVLFHACGPVHPQSSWLAAPGISHSGLRSKRLACRYLTWIFHGATRTCFLVPHPGILSSSFSSIPASLVAPILFQHWRCGLVPRTCACVVPSGFLFCSSSVLTAFYSEWFFLNRNRILLPLRSTSFSGSPQPISQDQICNLHLGTWASQVWQHAPRPSCASPTFACFAQYQHALLQPWCRTPGPPDRLSYFMPQELSLMKLLPLPGSPCSSLLAPTPKSAWLTHAYPSAILKAPSSSSCLLFYPPPGPLSHSKHLLPSTSDILFPHMFPSFLRLFLHYFVFIFLSAAFCIMHGP